MRTVDEWLTSDETGTEFSHCVRCGVSLLEIDAPWLVTKDYFKNECILEYAICQPCRDKVTDQISEESKESVRRFLETEIDWEARVTEFMNSPNPANRFSQCIACRAPREVMDGFAISALFDSGGHLVTGPLPLLVCKPCVTRMTGELSDDSRAVWKQFLAEHFAGPPDDTAFPGVF